MNIEQFTTLLINSRLLDKSEAEQIAAVFQQECQKLRTTATLDALCSFLIATDRLTRWQCDKLKMGKWKGFYLDDYVLLEQSGKGPDFSSYKSRDVRNGRVVNLVIRPMNQTDGRIEYRVKPYSE